MHQCAVLTAAILAVSVAQAAQQGADDVGGRTQVSRVRHAEYHYWFGLGMGGGSTGFSIGCVSSLQAGKHVFSVRCSYNEESDMASFARKDTDWDVALLYGRAARQTHTLLSLSIGLSAAGGTHKIPWYIDVSPSDRDRFGPKLGLPVEAQALYIPASFIGLGIYGFANINSESSFAGILFTLYFGKLRP